MFGRLGRPSPALIISCISLFVALGGVGYAAATGSIDGREIKNNSVASKDIKNSSVASGDVKNSALTGTDIKNESLKGSDIDESGLGRVPSAGQADNAGTASFANSAGAAGTANNVGGVRIIPFNYRQDGSTSDETPMGSLHGLEVRAACSGGDNDLKLYNRSGQIAEITYSNVDDTPNTSDGDRDTIANDSFENVAGLPVEDDGNTGHASFYNEVTDQHVRVLYTLDQNRGIFECSIQGMIIG